jgi:CDP-diacylglycerol--serine O-phosphatidyltransferase
MIRYFFSHNDEDDTENRPLLGTKMLPNALTIAALCIGLTALRFGIDGRWTNAMTLVLIAAVLDGMDGMVARLLKASTPFGAELDSFSDFVSFGVSPAILLYLWNLQDAGPLGWIASLLLCVAVALRLARFNVKNMMPSTNPNEVPLSKSYFEGVPAPAGAILALLPMMLSFKIFPEEEGGFPSTLFPSVLVTLWVVFVAALMVSRLPTYSLKRLPLTQRHKIPALAFIALLVAALATDIWMTIVLLSLIYVGSIVHSVKRYQRQHGTNIVIKSATPDVKDEPDEIPETPKAE